jgi:hypothetical protein
MHHAGHIQISLKMSRYFTKLSDQALIPCAASFSREEVFRRQKVKKNNVS